MEGLAHAAHRTGVGALVARGFAKPTKALRDAILVAPLDPLVVVILLLGMVGSRHPRHWLSGLSDRVGRRACRGACGISGMPLR